MIRDIRDIVAMVDPDGGEPCAGGTAFLIDVNKAMTCHHCLLRTGGAIAKSVTLHFRFWKVSASHVDTTVLGEGLVVPAHVLTTDPDCDTALLEIEWAKAAPRETGQLSGPSAKLIESAVRNILYPLASGVSAHESWRSYGFVALAGADGKDFGGKIERPDAVHYDRGPLLALRCTDAKEPVAGTSGMPVLVAGNIVGMVQRQFLRNGRAGSYEYEPAFETIYATSLATMRDSPKLRPHIKELDERISARLLYSHGHLFCDRASQWKRSKRVIRRTGPSVIIARGSEDSALEKFIERFRRDEDLRRQLGLRVRDFKLPWPERGTRLRPLDFQHSLALALTDERDVPMDSAKLLAQYCGGDLHVVLLAEPFRVFENDVSALQAVYSQWFPTVIKDAHIDRPRLSIIQPVVWRPRVPPAMRRWAERIARTVMPLAQRRPRKSVWGMPSTKLVRPPAETVTRWTVKDLSDKLTAADCEAVLLRWVPDRAYRADAAERIDAATSNRDVFRILESLRPQGDS